MTDEFLTMAKQSGRPPVDLASALGISVSSYFSRLSGRVVHPYALMALKAVLLDLDPATDDDAHAHYVDLGVTRQTAHNWRTAGIAPLEARLAVAWIKDGRKDVTI